MSSSNRTRRSEMIHWINHLHFFDPQHSFRGNLWTSTYLNLESYLPTSKCCWRGEFVKMKIWDLQSLLVCPIILLKNLPYKGWLNFWLTVRIGISDLELVFGFHSSPPVRSDLVLIYENSMDSIPADKVLKMTRLDWQKRFPIYHVCPKCLAAPLCGSAFL